MADVPEAVDRRAPGSPGGQARAPAARALSAAAAGSAQANAMSAIPSPCAARKSLVTGPEVTTSCTFPWRSTTDSMVSVAACAVSRNPHDVTK